MNPIAASATSGLQPDTAPALQPGQVVYVLNGRVESGGASDGLWANEPANELAFVLPLGKSVVASLRLTELSRTLLFLAGSSSEIGWVDHTLRSESYTNRGIQTGTGLASLPVAIDRSPVGQYNTLLTAPCLDFRPATVLAVRYKFEGSDLYLYLADGIHPDRRIRFTLNADNSLSLHTDSRQITGLDSCQAPIYGPALDCDRCRLDPLMDALALSVRSVQVGGVWEAGALQFRAAYATAEGERLTEFTAGTGFVPIWENALSTQSGKASSQSVTLQLQSTSSRYTHVVIGVLQVIGGQTKSFQLEPYPLSAGTIVLRGNETRQDLSMGELLEARTHYDSSVGLASTDDRLLRFGLREKPIGNIQRFFLNIPIQWESIQLPEGAYKEGAIAERFKSYQRDEVVALGLVLAYDDGDESGVIHLPGRSPLASDLALVTHTDAQVVQYVEKLTSVPRWKVENTATVVTPGTYIPFTSLDNPGSWRTGNLGYWESTQLYPNRPDVWGALCGKPIRHHRMPDSALEHIHDGWTPNGVVTPLVKTGGFIYPLGLRVSADAIRAAIQAAEAAGELPAGRVTGWRLVRADRTGEASILATGLLFDMNQYVRKGKTVFYPNQPFNDLRADPMLTADADTYKHLDQPITPLPFVRSDTYTFHSPEVHFTPVGKAQYLKLETEEFGQAEGQYVLAQGQARQKLPTPGLTGTALALTDASVSNGNIFSHPDPLLRAFTVLAQSQTYITLLRSAVPFLDYGVQYVGVGWYNQWKAATVVGNRLRPLKDQALLEPEIQQVGGRTVNNRFRERSLLLGVDIGNSPLPRFPFLPPPVATDRSRFRIGDAGALDTTLVRPVSSYYASLRVARPAQYGRIASIQYLELGRPNTPRTQTGSVSFFGGDTFIGRFSLKRKHSYFSQTRFGLPDGTDTNYSQLPNVAYPVYFYNMDNGVLTDAESGASPQAVINVLTNMANRLDLPKSKFLYYDGVIYLYSYGIPYFFTESAVNLDLRQADDLLEGGFFPLVDPQNWTQENQVPIQRDNAYRYDKSYSHPLRENKLLAYPDSQLYNQLADQFHPNRVIWSEAGNWRYFKALNSKDLDRKHGLLTGLDGLDSGKILVRFEDGSALLNAYAELQTSTGTAQLGTGRLFGGPVQEFAQADGGLLGSQHRELLQTPFGYVWADAKRGALYLLPPGGSPTPLQSGPIEHWLGRHLPSRLLTSFPDVPDYKTSIRMVYDTPGKRLILTRHDLYLKKAGLRYEAASDRFLSGTTPVAYGDPAWFGDCSWTVSYHFPSKQWAFLSFAPTYLLGWPGGFVSLLNSPMPSLRGSGWVHRNSRLQFQRFFGGLAPFELRIWTGPLGVNKYLQGVQYAADVRRYHQGDQFVNLSHKTYSELVVASDRQSSGLIHLKPGDFTDQRNLIASGPRLIQQPGGSWAINGLYDKTQPGNTLPLWISDDNDVRQLVNRSALRTTDDIRAHAPLSGNGFVIHFIQSTDDNHQYIHTWTLPDLQ